MQIRWYRSFTLVGRVSWLTAAPAPLCSIIYPLNPISPSSPHHPTTHPGSLSSPSSSSPSRSSSFNSYSLDSSIFPRVSRSRIHLGPRKNKRSPLPGSAHVCVRPFDKSSLLSKFRACDFHLRLWRAVFACTAPYLQCSHSKSQNRIIIIIFLPATQPPFSPVLK